MKKWFALGIKVILSSMVFIFLANSTIKFFDFIVPTDAGELAIYKYLGIGLTGGGMIGYLGLFLWDEGTKLKKTIALIMMVVCLIGELFTAGFGMQVAEWRRAGVAFDAQSVSYMLLAVQLLALAHGLALIGYFAGEEIAVAWGDHDGDGIPNMIDPDYKRAKVVNKPAAQPAQAAQSVNPTSGAK